MYRFEASRSEKEDEIPYAQRTNSVRRFSSRQVKSLAFSSIFISVLFTILTFNFLFPGNNSVPYSLNTAQSSPDSSLLRHLPYPEAPSSELVDLYPGFQIHKDVLPYLLRMRAAARNDGVNLVFLSGFRSIELQNEIFYENKSIRNQIAIERSKVSAPPGYSEHSTGYAVDIGDRYRRETDFEVEFETTSAFDWLQKHAAKYHFVLSFPRDNPQKVSYEPWHWRFEGSVQALQQFESANRKRIDQESSN